MLKNDFKNNEELLLRKYAAGGKCDAIREILNKNKHNVHFNINAQSSNGNTALHWACFNAIEIHKGHSEKYNETIRLLIRHGASHLVKNNSGKIPHDILQDLHVNVSAEDLKNLPLEGSCYLTLMQELLKKECKKITSAEELPGELASATAFHFIIGSLKLFDFFPTQNRYQETFTILSLACGISSEIIPLIMYFQYQNKKINYIGIDNNRDIIEDNKARYANFENVEFICADASNFDEISNQIPLYSIDLGIMRNGDFTEHKNRQSLFCKIIDRIFPCLIKPDCPLLLTFQTQQELEVCSNKTQMLQKFTKFKKNNFCDIDKLCSFSAQHLNQTVITYPDRFSTILNSEKINYDQSLTYNFNKLSM